MMSACPDGTYLTEAQICELCGTSQQRRQSLVKRGLLRKVATPGCVVHDALELAQLLLLIGTLGPTDAALAWRQVRGELQAQSTGDELNVLFDTELKQASVLEGSKGLRALMDHGRPVRLVALAARRSEIAVAFRRVAEAQQLEMARQTGGSSGARGPS
jgi:hypothetical protein